jgi:predicted HTH domain antitoxin
MKSDQELSQSLELEKLITIERASEIVGISDDSFRSHLIRRITPRRIRVRDLLTVGRS